MDSILILFKSVDNKGYNSLKRIKIYPLARSGDLLHSITISQKRIGHNPIEGIIMNYLLTKVANIKHDSTNKISIITALVMNLKVCLTVPSIFSCYIAVGK